MILFTRTENCKLHVQTLLMQHGSYLCQFMHGYHTKKERKSDTAFYNQLTKGSLSAFSGELYWKTKYNCTKGLEEIIKLRLECPWLYSADYSPLPPSACIWRKDGCSRDWFNKKVTLVKNDFQGHRKACTLLQDNLILGRNRSLWSI